MIFQDGTGPSQTNYQASDERAFWDRQKLGFVKMAYGNSYGRLDYLVTLPEHQQEALRAEIKRQFGLDVRYELRLTNVLRIQVKDAAKLKARVTRGGLPCAKIESEKTVVSWAITNQPASVFEVFLEGFLSPRMRVVDRTGTTEHYDFSTDWPTKLKFNPEQYSEMIKHEFENQLGLQLVPGLESVPMLAVERVKD